MNKAEHIKFNSGIKDKILTRHFIKSRSKAKYQYALSHCTANEIIESGKKVYLSPDHLNGFIIDSEGDIQNLFSLNHAGKIVIKEAVRNGGKKLDCFDGFLPLFYKQFGFCEVKRESNWNVGEPDVVYMALR
jgi:hypothetical protein